MSEILRLESLGWRAAPVESDGVRYLRRDGAQVSYPRDVFDTLIVDGGQGFWLDARANAVGALCRQAQLSALWDVGAGSGAMAKRLVAHGVEVVSIEPLPEGAREIAEMGAAVFCGTLEDLELPSASLPAIGLFDVLEHLNDPRPLLLETARVLVGGGWLFVTVPAYKWLWSAEDEALGHYRRYTSGGIRTTLESAGFTVLTSRYLFASLVPVAALLRALPYRLGLQRAKPEAVLARNASRLQPGAAVNRVAAAVLSAESQVARRVHLPLGLSVIAVARAVPQPGD